MALQLLTMVGMRQWVGVHHGTAAAHHGRYEAAGEEDEVSMVLLAGRGKSLDIITAWVM